jgi:spore germination protein KC
MKLAKAISLVLVMCFMLCACSASRNLSDLTIVQGVAIDADNTNTKVTLQYLNTEKNTGSTESLAENITAVTSGSGVNITSAVSSASKVLSDTIFFGQNKLIVFGYDYAKESITKGLDYLLRGVDSRPDVLLAMSDKTAKEIIESEERGSRVPAQSIADLLKTGEKNGISCAVYVSELMNLYADKTSDIYMPVLTPLDKCASCNGIAIFSNDKYATTLNEDETFGFLMMLDKVKEGTMTINSETLGNVSIDITATKTKNYVSVKDSNIVFNSEIKMEFLLNDVENGTTVSVNSKETKDIEKLVEEKIRKDCTNAFNTCKSNRSDVLMIGRYLAKSDSSVYDAKKDNWREYLPNVSINLTVKTELTKVNDNSIA